MSTQLATFDIDTASKKPAYLTNFQSKVGKSFSVGGFSRNRIGLKGNRFRLIVNGQEEAIVEQNYLDVIIVGAAEKVSRIFFPGTYTAGVKTSPSCYSADGETPAADVKNPQATKCALCPQNEKGSRTTADGIKTKACSYFKRLAVVLAGDTKRVFQLDCKGLSIFGSDDAAQNKLSLSSYAKKLETRGRDVGELVTRLSFDTESSVPKLYFTPVNYISQNDANAIADVMVSNEVKAILEINSQTTDSSDEVDAAPKMVKNESVQEAPIQRVIKKAESPAVISTTEDEDLEALISKLDTED